MNIFEQASREKLRFASDNGAITVEQLWDLPLVARRADSLDLDKLARAVNSELKGFEDSFVNLNPDPRKTKYQLQLDILRYIIDVKKEEQKKALEATANANRRSKLLAALSAKEESTLQGMSKEEIEAEIAKLS